MNARPDRTEPVDRTEGKRPTRTPLGARNRLTFTNLDPNYQYRVINDVDDRLERAQEAGYEFVESKRGLGEQEVMDSSKLGAKVSKPVGNGTVGYLMRIPKEWYDEDQQKKLNIIAETERSTKPKKEEGQYGPGLIDTR